MSFIKCKILPCTDIKAFFKSLICDKNERNTELQMLLDRRMSNEKCEFVPIDYNSKLKSSLLPSYHPVSNVTSHYEGSMNIASNILLEFCAFPNLTNTNEKKLPCWLEALVVSACCKEASKEIQLIAMNIVLEIFSLSKNQNYLKTYENEKNIIITGILEYRHVYYIEENTLAIEVILPHFLYYRKQFYN